QTTALAARELAGTFALIRSLEVEATEIGPRWHFELADTENVGPVRDDVKNRLVGIQSIARLVNIGQFYRRPDLDGAAVRLLLARNHPEQGGLPRTVGPDDPHEGARRHPETQVVDEQAISVGLADTVEHDDFV